jgi:proliferating cell nuclear antigen PCNA
MEGNKLLEIVTEHSIQLRVVFEVLQDIFHDVNIDIIKDKNDVDDESDVDNTESESGSESGSEASDSEVSDESASGDESESGEESAESEDEKQSEQKNANAKSKSGIKLEAVDTSGAVFVYMRLDAKHFMKFKCEKSKITLGVKLSTVCDAIKQASDDHHLTMYVNNDDRQYLHMVVGNPDNGVVSEDKILLLDLDEEDFEIPVTEFEAKITMSASEFHKTCKGMSKIGHFIEILCVGNKLTLKCKGDMSERTKIYKDMTDVDDVDSMISIEYSNNFKGPHIIRGFYELKNITYFNKFSPLCPDIELFMKDEYPLGIMYTVAKLGKIVLFLTPININGEDHDYDETLYQDEKVEYV